MSKSVYIILGISLLAAALHGCAKPPASVDAQRPAPASVIRYRLAVDPTSLPEGVAVRERHVPGTGPVQAWVGNESEVPFVIQSVDSKGNVVRRQKIVGGRVYLETHERQWQLLEGVDEVLLGLNYTPAAVVDGRFQDAGTAALLPPPEPFSISATFGDTSHPIRGQIVYFPSDPGAPDQSP